MTFIKYIPCIFAIFLFGESIKVDMQGSLVLGKDVLDTLNYYFRRAASSNSRRSMDGQTNAIAMEVISSSLCRKINFCVGALYQFINEYVIALAQVSESVFDDIHNIDIEEKLQAAAPLFGKLKGCLRGIRKIIKAANVKATDVNEDYIWVGLIKKISAEFQTRAVAYVADKLNADAKDDVIKKVLTQKLVVRIAETELLYQKKLCQNHRICSRSLLCTNSLNNVLERLSSLPKNRVKSFIRSLFELLPETSLYTRLSGVTANEFQVILNDMAFADHVPTKDILLAVQKIVANRINNIYSKEEVKQDQDTLLVHIILSDLDFFYSKGKSDTFDKFFNDFIVWTRTGGRVTKILKEVIKNIQNTLYRSEDTLIAKLSYEVRVFLEITVDPEQDRYI